MEIEAARIAKSRARRLIYVCFYKSYVAKKTNAKEFFRKKKRNSKIYPRIDNKFLSLTIPSSNAKFRFHHLTKVLLSRFSNSWALRPITNNYASFSNRFFTVRTVLSFAACPTKLDDSGALTNTLTRSSTIASILQLLLQVCTVKMMDRSLLQAGIGIIAMSN